MLGCIHYGSTNEKHKIAYEKPPLAPCADQYEFFQMRKLPGPEEASHRVRLLRFLPRQESFESHQKGGKETEEG